MLVAAASTSTVVPLATSSPKPSTSCSPRMMISSATFQPGLTSSSKFYLKLSELAVMTTILRVSSLPGSSIALTQAAAMAPAPSV